MRYFLREETLKQLRLFILILFFSLLFTGCKKAKKFSEENLLEIYTAVELEPVVTASKVAKKYGLNDEKKRDRYYEALRNLSTNQEKWQNFLRKVDEYKKKMKK